MDPVEKGEARLSFSCLNWILILDSTAERPATLALGSSIDPSDNNFFTQQARLQIEARMALAQAKDMAHMQMEVSAKNPHHQFKF